MSKFKIGDRVKPPVGKSTTGGVYWKETVACSALPKDQDYLVVIDIHQDIATIAGDTAALGSDFRMEDLEPYSSLPEKWAIERTLENYREINDWANKHPVKEGDRGYRAYRGYIHSEALSDDSTVAGSYRAKQDDKISEGFTPITIEQFREITKQSPAMKKIIGYKAPYELFNEVIKQGTVYSSANSKMYVPTIGINPWNHALPKEIVETWEPVYESEEVVIELGDKKTKVQIGKDLLRADNTLINADQLDAILLNLFKVHKLNKYNISIVSVKVGCTTCTLYELGAIMNKYKELNL